MQQVHGFVYAGVARSGHAPPELGLIQCGHVTALKPTHKAGRCDGKALRLTQAGDWECQTDQAIRETSMNREVKADTETRERVSRETRVKATDRTSVIGTASLMAGAIHTL